MNVIHYWQRLTKRLIIKKALSHLLLGVIATGFSLSEQNALPVHFSNSVNIITIASLVQVHEQQIVNRAITHVLHRPVNSFNADAVVPTYCYIPLGNVIRLSPHNGIRAGPVETSRIV